MVDINELQKNIDSSNENPDEYSFYDKAIPNTFLYKLTREEYYNLNMDEKREKEETMEQYKLRRNKIKHYQNNCTHKLFWPSKVLGTYNLHDEQRMNKQIERIQNLVQKQKDKVLISSQHDIKEGIKENAN